MAISIGELRGIISLQDQFSGPANNVAKQLGFMSTSFGAVTKFAGLAVGAVSAAGTAIAALGIHGSKVASMESSFDALTKSVGTTAAAMLAATRSGSSGLIADMDLMAASNKAILLGLPVTTESMGTMAKAATVLGRAMGQDARKSLDDLTTALGRGSPLILDNLGLTVKVSEANEEYARSIGKSSSQLTEADKKMAFYNAAMEAARTKVAELGEVQLTFGDRVQQGRAMVENFVGSLGKAIATSPVVAAGMDSIMRSIQGAFGGDQQKTIDTLMGFVNRFAIGLTHAADVGVEAARFLTHTWNGLKIAFNLVMTFVADAISGAAGAIATLAEKATGIPKIGHHFAGVADTMRGVADHVEAMRNSFAEQTDEAIEKAMAQEAAFQGIHDQIGSVRAAMEAAQGASALMADTASTVTTRLGETGAAAALTAEQLKAMEDATRAGQEALFDMAAEGAEKMRTLHEEITLANLFGLERRTADIEIARQKEIAGLQHLAFTYPQIYDEIVALVNEKYGQMSAAAQGSFASVEEFAAAAGFKTREELQRAADVARAGYQAMLASGKFTYTELAKAHAAAKAAEDAVEQKSAMTKTALFGLLASSASSILRSLFGKSKAAAIAAAIIDTAAAVAKALSAYPWPFNLAPAAAAAAAGFAQVNAIRSTNADGFAEGTPGTRFEDFGRGSLEMLHGPEAVVTKAQGESLAGMVGDAIQKAMGTGSGAGGWPQSITIPVIIGGHRLDELIMQRTRAGYIQVAT